MNVIFNKNGIEKQVKVGFSWTVSFFGPLCLLYRKQYGMALLFLILDSFTWGLAQCVYAFWANKHLAEALVVEGWDITESQREIARAAWGISRP